eukprot:2395904-Rhodomonas_salina.3
MSTTLQFVVGADIEVLTRAAATQSVGHQSKGGREVGQPTLVEKSNASCCILCATWAAKAVASR